MPDSTYKLFKTQSCFSRHVLAERKVNSEIPSTA